jgi:hypothetical protein
VKALTKDQCRAVCINKAAAFVLPVLLNSRLHNSCATTHSQEPYSTRPRLSLAGRCQTSATATISGRYEGLIDQVCEESGLRVSTHLRKVVDEACFFQACFIKSILKSRCCGTAFISRPFWGINNSLSSQEFRNIEAIYLWQESALERLIELFMNNKN